MSRLDREYLCSETTGRLLAGRPRVHSGSGFRPPRPVPLTLPDSQGRTAYVRALGRGTGTTGLWRSTISKVGNYPPKALGRHRGQDGGSSLASAQILACVTTD